MVSETHGIVLQCDAIFSDFEIRIMKYINNIYLKVADAIWTLSITHTGKKHKELFSPYMFLRGIKAITIMDKYIFNLNFSD